MGAASPQPHAELSAFLGLWASAAADRLRQGGYVGTDTELVATYVHLKGARALGAEFLHDLAYQADLVCDLVRRPEAEDVETIITGVLGFAIPQFAAALQIVVAALNVACGRQDG